MLQERKRCTDDLGRDNLDIVIAVFGTALYAGLALVVIGFATMHP